MRATFATLAAVALLVSAPVAQTKTAKPAKTLDIYALDVEGGKATLFITPAGESVLIDSAKPGGARHRSHHGASEAGVKEIDYLISTHYHVDHIGGVQELAKRSRSSTTSITGRASRSASRSPDFRRPTPTLAKAKHTVAKPGDKLPVTGVDWRIVTPPAPRSRRRCPAAESRTPRAPTSRKGTTVPPMTTASRSAA